MRPLQELVDQTQFAKQLESRGVNRVAAEIAEEVGVLLQHHYIASRARKEEAGHHSRRTATGNHKIMVWRHDVSHYRRHAEKGTNNP